MRSITRRPFLTGRVAPLVLALALCLLCSTPLDAYGQGASSPNASPETTGQAAQPPPENPDDPTTFPDDAPLPPETDGDALNIVTRSDDSLLILELVVDQESVLDPGFLAYMVDDDVIVPLGHLMELFDFKIDVNVGTGVIEGWFLNEDNTFYLAPPYEDAIVKGKPIPVGDGIVENHVEDIYVSATLFNQWFPVKLNMNFNELRLYVETEQDLPFQTVAKRRANWETLKNQSRKPEGKIDGPVIKLPYRMFAVPSVQVNHSAQVNSTAGERTLTTNHSIQTQGDLLGMNSRTNLNFFADGEGRNALQSILFNLSKRDYDGGLLGDRIDATHYELGDVSTGNFPLVGGQSGRGFTVDNLPLNYVRTPEDFVVDGFGPVGWDVEVYQDGRLLDFTTIDAAGEFTFDTLPLRDGFNLFRIVLYGPNGEKEERFDRYYLGRNMVEKGKFLYEVSALQSSTRLFDVSADKAPVSPPTLSLLGEYGVTDNLSVHGGYITSPLGPGKINAFGAGARLSGTRTFTELNALYNSDGAYSLEANVTGNLSKTLTWSAGHKLHEGYDEDLRPTKRESYARISKQISNELFPNASLQFELKNELSDTDIETTQFINRFSGAFAGLNLTNELEYTIRSAGIEKEILGTLTVRKRLPIGTFRGRVNYDLGDMKEIENVQIQFQSQLAKNIFINTFLNSQLSGTKQTELATTFDIRFERVRLGLTLAGDDQGDWRAGLNLAYNFVPRSLYGDYMMTGDSSDLNQGTLIVEPFLDTNLNLVRDEGEPIIPDVTVKNVLRGQKDISDESGQAVIGSMTPNVVNTIEIDTASLPDIYMTPGQKSLYVSGKRGINGPIGFPIHQLGEISGTIYGVMPDGTREPLPDVEILLVNPETEEIVAETISEFDGFYIIPSLRIGTYNTLFPESRGLANIYSGDREGPTFVLTPDSPEVSEADILVLDDDIIFMREEIQIQTRNTNENMQFLPLNMALLHPLRFWAEKGMD